MKEWTAGEWKCGYEVIIEHNGIRETFKNGYPVHNEHAYEMIGRIIARNARHADTKVIKAEVTIEGVA